MRPLCISPACLLCVWFSCCSHVSLAACESITLWFGTGQPAELRLRAAFEWSDSKSICSTATLVFFCSLTVNGTWMGITLWSSCPLQLYYHWLSWSSWVCMNVSCIINEKVLCLWNLTALVVHYSCIYQRDIVYMNRI